MSAGITTPMWTYGTSLRRYILTESLGFCWVAGPALMLMEPIINEIRKALNAGLYYLALSVVLTLPDICVSLISEDGRSTGVRYREWCDNNLGSEFSFVTGKDLYSMRCGVVHNGRLGDMAHNVSRVVFVLPGNIAFSNCLANDMYIYNAVDFCNNFVAAVERWYVKHIDNKNVSRNAGRVMRYRFNGIAPILVGVPVIG
ncbi:hypothetical protein ACRAWG_12690 [Methylobacterium sp. P31]